MGLTDCSTFCFLCFTAWREIHFSNGLIWWPHTARLRLTSSVFIKRFKSGNNYLRPNLAQSDTYQQICESLDDSMIRWLYKFPTSLSATCLKEETVDHPLLFLINKIDHIKGNSTSVFAVSFPLNCFKLILLNDLMDTGLNKSHSPSPLDIIPLRLLREVIEAFSPNLHSNLHWNITFFWMCTRHFEMSYAQLLLSWSHSITIWPISKPTFIKKYQNNF